MRDFVKSLREVQDHRVDLLLITKALCEVLYCEEELCFI